MTFILKAVVILFLFSFVVYVFKSLARLRFHVRNTAKEINKIRTSAGQPNGANSTQMLRCVACGAFVASGEAVQVRAAGQSQVFCSRDCLHLHAKTA